MSATGQFAEVVFGDWIGKSPGRHCAGSSPGVSTGFVSVLAGADRSYGSAKYHSPLICTRVAVGSLYRKVTVYPVGAGPVCTTSGPSAGGAPAVAVEMAVTSDAAVALATARTPST